MTGARQADLFEIAMKIFDAAAGDETKIRGRIQYLQRRGEIPGVNTGRGVGAVYSYEALWTCAVLLECSRLGVKEQAVDWLAQAGDWIANNAKPEVDLHFVLPGRRSSITIDMKYLAGLIDPVWQRTSLQRPKAGLVRARDVIDVRVSKHRKKMEAALG